MEIKIDTAPGFIAIMANSLLQPFGTMHINLSPGQ